MPNISNLSMKHVSIAKYFLFLDLDVNSNKSSNFLYVFQMFLLCLNIKPFYPVYGSRIADNHKAVAPKHLYEFIVV